MRSLTFFLSMFATACTLAACSSDDDADPSPGPDDARAVLDTGSPADAGDTGNAADASDAAANPRFATKVQLTPGPCAGFGAADAAKGPPHGGGATQGGLDVVSLGVHGEITLSFEPNAIVDKAGPDFIVFENAFNPSGNPQKPYAEPGEVSVSDDGTNWKTYPCTATAYPYGACAGWHPVYSTPENGISATDPAVAGGDAFDLADVGLTHVKYVRIRDKTTQTCDGSSTTTGFDLDAVSIVHPELP